MSDTAELPGENVVNPYASPANAERADAKPLDRETRRLLRMMPPLSPLVVTVFTVDFIFCIMHGLLFLFLLVEELFFVRQEMVYVSGLIVAVSSFLIFLFGGLGDWLLLQRDPTGRWFAIVAVLLSFASICGTALLIIDLAHDGSGVLPLRLVLLNVIGRPLFAVFYIMALAETFSGRRRSRGAEKPFDWSKMH